MSLPSSHRRLVRAPWHHRVLHYPLVISQRSEATYFLNTSSANLLMAIVLPGGEKDGECTKHMPVIPKTGGTHPESCRYLGLQQRGLGSG